MKICATQVVLVGGILRPGWPKFRRASEEWLSGDFESMIGLFVDLGFTISVFGLKKTVKSQTCGEPFGKLRINSVEQSAIDNRNGGIATVCLMGV